jgi:hypothetical protein
MRYFVDLSAYDLGDAHVWHGAGVPNIHSPDEHDFDEVYNPGATSLTGWFMAAYELW